MTMLLCLPLLAVVTGCSSYADRLRGVRTEFHSGNLAAAEKFVSTELPKKRRAKEADVLKLERAMIELSSGKPAVAERTLREVRDRFDYLEQKDLAEGAASYLTDDTHRAYAGEDYEKVLIRSFLALSNLMHDGGDANAYALQVNAKQKQIIEAAGDNSEKNPKLGYKHVALGAYVSGMLREATMRDNDDAKRSIQLVANWEPEFASAKQDLERVTNGRHSAPGNGVLYVFTLVGRGPYKEERYEQPTQAAMLIVDHILSAIGKHTVTPTFAPVKVPVVVVPPNRVQSVSVSIDGKPAGLTETITDVGELATQQYAAIFPHLLARTVVRRSIKKGSLYAAKEFGQVRTRLENSPSTPSVSPGKRPRTPTRAAGDCSRTKSKSAASSFRPARISSRCNPPARPANRSVARNKRHLKSTTAATPTRSQIFPASRWSASCSSIKTRERANCRTPINSERLNR